MKRLIIVVFLFFIIVQVNAQSDNLAQMVKEYRMAFISEGMEIETEGYADINAYRTICSQEMNLSSEHSILLLIDGCIGAELYLEINGVQYHLDCKQECINNVTCVISGFVDTPYEGQVIGTISTPIWHKAYLFVVLK